MAYFRFIAGGLGIYAAVDRDCPRKDGRRQEKPDGSWLPKVGPDYPGAISFWTARGLKQYIDSGLLQWHAAVVEDEVEVLVADRVTALYRDEYQVICPAANAVRVPRWPLARFLGDWPAGWTPV